MSANSGDSNVCLRPVDNTLRPLVDERVVDERAEERAEDRRDDRAPEPVVAAGEVSVSLE